MITNMYRFSLVRKGDEKVKKLAAVVYVKVARNTYTLKEMQKNYE